MAEAQPIPGLKADDSYGEAAAKVISVRAAELTSRARCLDIGDIERVHDMRVATRRLRAALEVFEPCFPGKSHGQALREVKRLADGLGERRDQQLNSSYCSSNSHDPAPGQTILDLALGPGNTGFLALPRLRPGGRLISTDIAPEWSVPPVGEGGGRAPPRPGACMRRRRRSCADALGDASVDGVLCRWGLCSRR